MDVLRCVGGTVQLPSKDLVLVDRGDGGNLIVNPPRSVWERSELSIDELDSWGRLVAATGQAMLTELPQLEGGCVNYWEAGNWALNDAAPPKGPKRAPEHRQVHAHLLGRSRAAWSHAWRWGEAPGFPEYENRFDWAAKNRRLSPGETTSVVNAVRRVLLTRYAFADKDIETTAQCRNCAYPFAAGEASSTTCRECAT